MEKIIQLTAGQGPAECCQVVAQVLKILLKEAAQAGLRHEVLAREPGPMSGTLFSALVRLEGEGAEAFVQKWLGTIQWVGKSQLRPEHKRKNWYIGVQEVETGNMLELNEADIQYQAIRSGGPGGQHVNKVSTAIRATHVPTGLTVVASDSRSQSQNKKLATDRLKELVHLKNLDTISQNTQNAWQQHSALERGNPIRVFRGTNFKSNYVDKGYKSTRLKNKRDLRGGRFDEE